MGVVVGLCDSGFAFSFLLGAVYFELLPPSLPSCLATWQGRQMVGQVLARKSIQRLLRALFLITLVLVGSTRSHPTNTLVKDEEFIKARCSPSCEESDFSACYQKLLSVGDALADLKSFGRAADYHKQLVTLAAAHKIQDERVILGLLSVAEDLKKGGELEEADQTLAYAHFVLTSQVQAHSATSTQAKLEKAILLLQSEILDCQGDAVGALVKHEQALRHNASGNRMAVHDALKHVDLLWNVLNEPRHRMSVQLAFHFYLLYVHICCTSIFANVFCTNEESVSLAV